MMSRIVAGRDEGMLEGLNHKAVRSSIRNRLGLRVVRRMLEAGPGGFTGGGRSTRDELGVS